MKLIVNDYENHITSTILKLLGILLIAFTIQAATVYAEEETTTTQNTQEQINSQKVCQIIDKNKVILTDYRLGPDGEPFSNNNFGITDYIKITKSTIKPLTMNTIDYQNRICFYTINKTFISCLNQTSLDNIVIPTNSEYAKFTIKLDVNKPQFEICTNGNQAIYNLIEDNIEKLIMAIIIIMIIALIIK